MRILVQFAALLTLGLSQSLVANAACPDIHDSVLRTCILPTGVGASVNAPISMEICGDPQVATLVLAFKSLPTVIQKVTLSPDKLTYLPGTAEGYTAAFVPQMPGLVSLFQQGQFMGVLDCNPRSN